MCVYEAMYIYKSIVHAMYFIPVHVYIFMYNVHLYVHVQNMTFNNMHIDNKNATGKLV